MFPRYGRKNRKYKIRQPKNRMSWHKKVIIQLVASFVIVLFCGGLSFLKFMPKKIIKTHLYNTYSVGEWKKTFTPGIKFIKRTSVMVVSAYLEWFSADTDTKGISSSATDVPSVKAQKKTEETPLDNTSFVEKNSPVLQQAENNPPVESPAPEVWKMPAKGEVSSGFGERVHPVTGKTIFHKGVDIAANTGAEVYSVSRGVVERTGYDEANGNYVVVSHRDKITSVYIHLSEVKVSPEQMVDENTLIGLVGSTGISTGPHLHFEIKENEVSVDPGNYISLER